MRKTWPFVIIFAITASLAIGCGGDDDDDGGAKAGTSGNGAAGGGTAGGAAGAAGGGMTGGAAGNGTAGNGAAGTGTAGGGGAGPTNVTFESLKLTIGATCLESSCHGGTPPQADLGLTFDELVNDDISKTDCDGYEKYVVKGNPEQSFLYAKVAPDVTLPAGGGCGDKMPNPKVGQGELRLVDYIRAWIENQAPENLGASAAALSLLFEVGR